jgi:hypothetical protein
MKNDSDFEAPMPAVPAFDTAAEQNILARLLAGERRLELDSAFERLSAAAAGRHG